MRLGSVPSIFQDVLVYYKDLYGLLENISTKQHCKNGVKTFLHSKSKENLLFFTAMLFLRNRAAVIFNYFLLFLHQNMLYRAEI